MKNVLLLCPDFYLYKDIIVKHIEAKGFNVYFFENKMFPEDWKCSTIPFLSLIRQLVNPKYKQKYIESILKKVEDIKIDILFAINGFCVTKELVSGFKQRNPQMVSTLFLWDSLVYWKYQNVIDLFDYKYSFDHDDCERYASKGLKYFPDFFVQTTPCTKILYDVVHIGSVSVFSVDRIRILSEIQQECSAKGLKCYIKIVTNYPELMKRKPFKFILLFLFSPKYQKLFYNIFKYRNSPIFLTKPLSLSEVNRLESSSKAIVDIPPAKQKGLTIRSLEAINRGQKLLTTNKSVVLDTFFSRNNIRVIDKKQSEKIDLQFLNSPSDLINIDYLYINSWIDTVLCGE